MPEIKIIPAYIKSPTSMNSPTCRNNDEGSAEKGGLSNRNRKRLVGKVLLI